jgi:hypothetical protein
MIQAGGVTSSKPFLDLSKPEHLLKLKDRLKKYCQKVAYCTSWINLFGELSLTILVAQCRRIEELLTSQLQKLEKLEYACAKILSM